MVRCNVLTILFVVYPCSALFSQQEAPIPTTISPEAQEFLRSPQRAWVIPQNLKEWEVIQAEAEEVGRARSKPVFAALADEIEIRKMGGVDVHVIKPKRLNPADTDKALIHIHGGGYCMHSAESTYAECVPVADRTGLRVYCIDYRIGPQHAFPTALNDCVSAYREIIKEVAPGKIGIFGISAGGALTVTTALKVRDEGLPMPGALASITPCTDLTAGDSHDTLNGIDLVLSKMALEVPKAYAGGANLRDPLLSPVYAEYSEAFPPTIIQTGTRDLLLSDCARLHRKMKDDGVDVELSVWEGMWHGFHVIPNTTFPEARAGFDEVADFFAKKLKLQQAP